MERSHGTDQQEFHQLINFTGDIDIRKKPKEREKFYNCHCSHSALKGKHLLKGTVKLMIKGVEVA